MKQKQIQKHPDFEAKNAQSGTGRGHFYGVLTSGDVSASSIFVRPAMAAESGFALGANAVAGAFQAHAEMPPASWCDSEVHESGSFVSPL